MKKWLKNFIEETSNQRQERRKLEIIDHIVDGLVIIVVAIAFVIWYAIS